MIECKVLGQREYKKYSGIFTGDYVKIMDLKQDHSGTSMSQMEVLMWDFIIQCDIKIESRQTDIVITDNTKKEQ